MEFGRGVVNTLKWGGIGAAFLSAVAIALPEGLKLAEEFQAAQGCVSQENDVSMLSDIGHMHPAFWPALAIVSADNGGCPPGYTAAPD